MSRRMRYGLICVSVLALLFAGVWLWGDRAASAHARSAAARYGLATEDTVRCARCHNARGLPVPEPARGTHPTPWALAAGAAGQLFVACPPRRAVAEIDIEERRVRRWIPVGGHVVGVAVSAQGDLLAAALEQRDVVVLVDLGAGRVRKSIPVGGGPRDLCFVAGTQRLVVSNRRTHDVSIVDWHAGTEICRLPAGREPFAVAAAPGGALVAIASRRTELAPTADEPESEITLVDPRQARVRRRVRLRSCHMIEGMAFTPDGKALLVPTLVTRNRLPILQVDRGWTMTSALAVVDPASGAVAILPLSEPLQGFADPAGIAVGPKGEVALVASGGADELGVIDVRALLAERAALRPGGLMRLSTTHRYLRRRVPTGSNPRGVLALPAGGAAAFAVTERLDDAVALHAPDGRRVARISLMAAGPDDAVRRGERVFHDARYAFQAQFSCRSCHPGAHTDGLTYDFDIDGIGRNIVLNRSLHGVAGTQPFKWIGLNPSLRRQCGPRFAMVLSRADLFPEKSLDDLVAYLHSLRAPPPETGPDTANELDPGARERGRVIFHRWQRKDGTPIPAAGRCVTCHPGPLYTTRGRADVGTRTATDDTGRFDVPHLTGIASKAPFLHDGRALTLEQIWTAPDVGDRHGVVSDLTKVELNDLVAFLRGL